MTKQAPHGHLSLPSASAPLPSADRRGPRSRCRGRSRVGCQLQNALPKSRKTATMRTNIRNYTKIGYIMVYIENYLRYHVILYQSCVTVYMFILCHVFSLILVCICRISCVGRLWRLGIWGCCQRRWSPYLFFHSMTSFQADPALDLVLGCWKYFDPKTTIQVWQVCYLMHHQHLQGSPEMGDTPFQEIILVYIAIKIQRIRAIICYFFPMRFWGTRGYWGHPELLGSSNPFPNTLFSWDFWYTDGR